MLTWMPFREDSQLLNNSPTSIYCGFCMFEYAELAGFPPPLPGGIDVPDFCGAPLSAELPTLPIPAR